MFADFFRHFEILIIILLVHNVSFTRSRYPSAESIKFVFASLFEEETKFCSIDVTNLRYLDRQNPSSDQIHARHYMRVLLFIFLNIFYTIQLNINDDFQGLVTIGITFLV